MLCLESGDLLFHICIGYDVNSKYILSYIFMICKYFLTFCKKSIQKRVTKRMLAIFIEKYG